MSAEDLGRKLTDEVEETTLDSLLFKTICPAIDPYCSLLTGLDPLDRLLCHAANLPWPPIREHTDGTAIRNGDETTTLSSQIIEVTSPGPGNGRSSLLYLLAAAATCPKSDSAGASQARTIVIIDTNNRFRVSRLVQVMRQCISTIRKQTEAVNAARHVDGDVLDPDHNRKPDSSDEAVLTSALEHIHIFRPQSFDSFLSTVETLPGYLFNPSNGSRTRVPSGIFITDAAAFTWTQKSNLEDSLALASSRITTPDGGSNRRPAPIATTVSRELNLATKRLRSTLRELSGSLGGVKIMYGTSSSIDLGATRRLWVQRRAVRPFPPGTSAIEALRDARERNAAVGCGIFDVDLSSGAGGAAAPSNARSRSTFSIGIRAGGIEPFDHQDE